MRVNCELITPSRAGCCPPVEAVNIELPLLPRSVRTLRICFQDKYKELSFRPALCALWIMRRDACCFFFIPFRLLFYRGCLLWDLDSIAVAESWSCWGTRKSQQNLDFIFFLIGFFDAMRNLSFAQLLCTGKFLPRINNYFWRLKKIF